MAPRQSSSKISFNLPSDAHLVVVNSCARQHEVWKPDTKKPFVYEYIPALFVETKGSCPLMFTVVTTSGELHRAITEFSNAGTKEAKAEVMADGKWNTYSGFALVSVASGLPVVVTSATPAVFVGDVDSGCPQPVGALREWTITTKKPEAGKSSICVYVLLNRNREEFRLTVNSYSSFLGVYPKEGSK
jgi:hypothetical protein